MLTENYNFFLRGSVYFIANEGFAENFLYTCKKNHINLFNIKYTTDCVKGRIYYKDKKNILKAAKISGMSLSFFSQSGIPVTLNKLKYRFGLPAGLIAAFIICCVLSSVLWSINVETNSVISAEKTIEILNSVGIKTGVFTNQIDCKIAEHALENYSENINKATVNLAGSCLYVSILERDKSPDIQRYDYYTNIVAKKDGEIILCDVLSGSAVIKCGMPVVKGDMLVSGTVEVKDGSTRFVDSKAVIIARTVNVKSVPAPINFTAMSITKSKNIYQLNFFGLKLPLIKQKDNSFLSTYYADTNSSLLPIGITRENRTEKIEENITLTNDCAIMLAYSDYACAIKKEFSDCKILSREEKIINSQKPCLEAKIVCEENIVKNVEFKVEK